jgi:hypothetical protein
MARSVDRYHAEAGTMNCPYLTRITMVYCRASPVRKYMPADRMTAVGPCQGDDYGKCPLYRESLADAAQEVRDFEAEGCPFASPGKGNALS